MNSVTRKYLVRSRVVACSLAVASVITAPLGVFAQDGVVARQQVTAQTVAQQQNPPAQNPITQPLALSPDVPDTRVGIQPGQVQALGMQDAITLALQNNLDIEQFRQGVQISERSLYSLKGVYDILSTSDINYRQQTQPVVSIFGGGGASYQAVDQSDTGSAVKMC